MDPTYVPGLGSNRNGLAVGPIADKDAWYFGAGFDFSLNNNCLGLMDNTEVLAELIVDYKDWVKEVQWSFSYQPNGSMLAVHATGGVLSTCLPANTQTATVNLLTLAASPKIKFLKGNAFRPWIIPVGFELNVISPPSDAITVLTPGMQFGLGADYKIWKNLYVGADARYHYAPAS